MNAQTIQDGELTSSIAHHGAYIWETKRILETYVDTESYEEVKTAVVEENLLRKSSDNYRESILSEITRRYDLETNGFRETPLTRAFRRPLDDSTREWILYYEFSKEPIVTLLTTEFLYPSFHQGVLSIRKDDVREFIEEQEAEYPTISSWSEQTRSRVAQHYLAAMKNFGLLEGSTEKEFSYVYPPDELVAYVLYSLFEEELTNAEQIVEHVDWRLLLFDLDDVRERLRAISPRHVNYEKRGSVERLEPHYETLMECVDEF